MPDASVTDLEAQLAAARAAEEAESSKLADPAATPVKDALAAKPVSGGPHDFKERLTQVVEDLVGAGQVVSGDQLTSGKEADTIAVVIKLVGEILKELPSKSSSPFASTTPAP